MITAKYANEPPTLDGQLNETCWRQAAVGTGFVRSNGDDLAAQKTRFQVAYDDIHLYLAAEVQTHQRQYMGVGRTERDHHRILSRDESVLISAFIENQLLNLGINSRGTQYDVRDGEASWNPAWEAAIDTTDAGWNVEMSIPFTVIGNIPIDGDAMAFNVSRTEAESRTRSQWSPCFGEWNEWRRFGTLRLE
jgi:hypothetical protein